MGKCEDRRAKGCSSCWGWSKEQVSCLSKQEQQKYEVLHIPLAALSYPRYILGGIHMTNPAFLPNALLKEITGTEYNTKIPSFFNDNHNITELDLSKHN